MRDISNGMELAAAFPGIFCSKFSRGSTGEAVCSSDGGEVLAYRCLLFYLFFSFSFACLWMFATFKDARKKKKKSGV